METVPFNLERFRNGEPAYSINPLVDPGHSFYAKNVSTSPANVEYMNLHWRMAPPQDDGWIRHDGGACPIAWAEAGQYELRYRNSETATHSDMHSANEYDWNHRERAYDIVSWRLTGRWIPILNGKCSLQLTIGEMVDCLFVLGNKECLMYAGSFREASVAVRRVKQEPDANCVTTPDGGCIGKGRCMHREIGIIPAVSIKWQPITLAEIRAAKPRPEPIRSIMQDIEWVIADVRDGVKKKGLVVDCGIISKLMKK